MSLTYQQPTEKRSYRTGNCQGVKSTSAYWAPSKH